MKKIWLTGFIFCLPFLPVWIFRAKYDLLNGFLLEIFWLFFCRGLLCYWEPGRDGKNSNCTHSGLYDPTTRWHAAKTSLQKYICVLSVLSRLFRLTFFVLKAGKPSRSWISKNHSQVEKSLSCKNGKEMYRKVRCTSKVVVIPTSIVVFWRSRCRRVVGS